MQNEVWKVWLQKELILVGFWLSKVGWIGFSCLGSKIGEKVKSWFLNNHGGEFPKMHPKWGVKSLVAKRIDVGWVLAYPSLVAWPSFCALVAKLVKKWSRGLGAILVGNCHQWTQNEVSEVWLQKDLMLVGFWLSQVGWIGFWWLGSKIRGRILSNLGSMMEIKLKRTWRPINKIKKR